MNRFFQLFVTLTLWVAANPVLAAALEGQAVGFSTALDLAQQLKKLNMNAHKNTKLKVRKDLLETLDAAIALDKTISLM